MEVDGCSAGSTRALCKASFDVRLTSRALLGVSEHHARYMCRAKSEQEPLLCGALYGRLVDRTIDVTDCAPVKLEMVDGRLAVHGQFSDFRLEMVRQIYPQVDLVGWYSFGSEVTDLDRQVHALFASANSDVVLMKLDPEFRRLEELPVKFFEAVLDFSAPGVRTEFVPLKFAVNSTQIDLIAINDVFCQPLFGSQGGTMVMKQMMVHMNAIKILRNRFVLLREYVGAVLRGSLPRNIAIVRDIASLCHSLATASDQDSSKDFETVRNNMAISELLNLTAKTDVDIQEVLRLVMWSRVALLAGRLSKMQSLRGACGGLFQNADLCTPDGFPSLMERVHSECDRLCREARSPHRDRKMVEILDEMSNTICIVADTAECMRLLHPDIIYAQAAEDTVAALGTLIEELNTSSELYELVRRAVREGDVQPLDGVDQRVGELLLKDFETSGIQFPDRQRAEFVSLSRQIFASGAQFMRGCEEPTFVPSEAVPARMRAYLRDVDGSQYALYSALLDNGDTDVRRFGYKMYYSPLASQEALLRTLLSCRSKQASLVGYGSYADRALQSMLLNHGSTVAAFLEATLDAVRAQAYREIRLLERYAGRGSEKSNVWDWPYMTYMARYKMFELNSSSVLPYLKLENVVHNLSIILDQLYGVRIDVQPTEDGEVWHESVTKWVVRDGSGRSLGLIYCDWYDRLGKVGESHFTIRCSKRLPDGSQQLPVVVLSFRMTKWSDEETYLSQSQLENLLHEVGHALHSLFGRTRYQHVAGTRCSTDFAEVPSNLMEKWASDRRMLSALTGGQMPDNLVDKWCASRRSFGAMELAQQCLLALVDLRLHHTYNADEPIEDTVRFCRGLYEEAGFGDWMPEGTAWHHRLSHLVPYGSKYSSYLVARGAASLLWRHCFAEEPFSSRAGSDWRRVQAYGGEKGSADLLQDAIGYVPSPANLADALQLDVRREPV